MCKGLLKNLTVEEIGSIRSSPVMPSSWVLIAVLAEGAGGAGGLSSWRRWEVATAKPPSAACGATMMGRGRRGRREEGADGRWHRQRRGGGGGGGDSDWRQRGPTTMVIWGRRPGPGDLGGTDRVLKNRGWFPGHPCSRFFPKNRYNSGPRGFAVYRCR